MEQTSTDSWLDLFLSILFEFYESLDLLSISWLVNLIDRFFVESFICASLILFGHIVVLIWVLTLARDYLFFFLSL